MRIIMLTVLVSLVLACCASRVRQSATVSDGDFILECDPRHPDWKSKFRRGEKEAHEDIKRGILGWDENCGGDEKMTQKLWCFRKVLSEKYRVHFRLRGHRPIESFAARIEGYQSVMEPHLESLFGENWYRRAWAEAEAQRRDHWPKLERQYVIDTGPSFEYLKTHRQISVEEKKTADPFDKYYAYRDIEDY